MNAFIYLSLKKELSRFAWVSLEENPENGRMAIYGIKKGERTFILEGKRWIVDIVHEMLDEMILEQKAGGVIAFHAETGLFSGIYPNPNAAARALYDKPEKIQANIRRQLAGKSNRVGAYTFIPHNRLSDLEKIKKLGKEVKKFFRSESGGDIKLVDFMKMMRK